MRAYLIKNTIGLLLAIATGSAFAQFVWTDANGTRQYSDQPPPASVPKNRILREPGAEVRSNRPSVTGTDPTASAPVKDPAAAPKGPMTTAEKNADFSKRKNEQAEKDKKAADEAKEAADRGKNCERAQAYNRSLQSGERIAGTDKNGEKTYLSDEKRAQDLRDTKRALEGCK